MIYKIKDKVATINAAHAHANLLYGVLTTLFEPYVGKKIWQKSNNINDFIPKLKKEIEASGLPTKMFCTWHLKEHQEITIIRHGTNTLKWVIATNIWDDYSRDTYKVPISIGTVDSYCLKDLKSNFHPLRIDYTVKEALNNLKKYKVLINKASKKFNEIAKTFSEDVAELTKIGLPVILK